jgi:hypothetical protein
MELTWFKPTDAAKISNKKQKNLYGFEFANAPIDSFSQLKQIFHDN